MKHSEYGTYLAIKDKNGEFKQYSVQNEVYTYVKQLEWSIRRPESNRLKELYPERFFK